jgi:hypothetical protein
MKRQGAEAVLKQLEGKSPQEQLEFWQRGTEDLKKLQKKLREANNHS